jgi:hypothetical protein
LIALLLAGVVTLNPGTANTPRVSPLASKGFATHCRLGQSSECWVPYVQYRVNISTDVPTGTPIYETRYDQLLDGEHDFESKADCKAYVENVLSVRGFWTNDVLLCDEPGEDCLYVPPSAIERVTLRQIVHP